MSSNREIVAKAREGLAQECLDLLIARQGRDAHDTLHFLEVKLIAEGVSRPQPECKPEPERRTLPPVAAPGTELDPPGDPLDPVSTAGVGEGDEPEA